MFVCARTMDARLCRCRERFENIVDPMLSKRPWTQAEDDIILTMQRQHGNKWVVIAASLRTY